MIFVEKLTNAAIDGVCFWLDDVSPVIGMTLKPDTIDNFWFVLRHEIEHVFEQDGKTDEVIDLLEGDNASSTSKAISEQERIANAAAADFCAPAAKLDSFMVRKHPFYYEKDVLAFARMHHRHPGIIVGQMQKRMDRWNYLTNTWQKIRQCVLPAAIVDGAGANLASLIVGGGNHEQDGRYQSVWHLYQSEHGHKPARARCRCVGRGAWPSART